MLFSTFDFADISTTAGLATLAQVVFIDLTMAGDNIVILGTVASGLPTRDRQRVIMLGVGFSLVFLIGFALVATLLLKIPGLLLAGGLTLLWVAWSMATNLRHSNDASAETAPRHRKSFLQAAIQVAVADLSMSIDNVLAVASAARGHPAVLVIGLVLSVTLMGLAASFVARLVERYRWVAYVGLAVIVYVAVTMVWDGIHQLPPVISFLAR